MVRGLDGGEMQTLGIGVYSISKADVDGNGVYKASLNARCPECGVRGTIYVKWKRLDGHPESSCVNCGNMYAYLPDA